VALRPPPTPPSGKIVIPKKSTWPTEMCVEFELSSSSSFRDMKGPKFTLGGATPVARPLAEEFSYLKRVPGAI